VRTVFVKVEKHCSKEFLQDLGSFGHNFSTRNARKSIQASKDSYFSLEFKQTLSDNFGSLSGRWRHKKNKKAKHTPTLTTSTENPKRIGLAPRTRWSGSKFQKQALFVTSPRENPKPESKMFFHRN